MLLPLSQRPFSSTGRQDEGVLHTATRVPGCTVPTEASMERVSVPSQQKPESRPSTAMPLPSAHTAHSMGTKNGRMFWGKNIRTPPRLTLWNCTRGHMALKTILIAFWSNESKLLTEGWRQQMGPESYTVSFKLMLLLTGRSQCTVY